MKSEGATAYWTFRALHLQCLFYMLRYFTSGESHGEALVAFLSGLPAGLAVDQAFRGP